MTLPLVAAVTLVLVGLSAGGDDDSPPAKGPITVAAPPEAAAQQVSCAKLLAVLPPRLEKLDQRVVTVKPEIASVVAWGSPAVVLRCGVARPKDLVPGSAAPLAPGGDTVNGPWYDVTSDGDAAVWTTVDRGPYVSITVPTAYSPDSVIVPLSTLIRQVLPAVCRTESNAPTAQLCTRRP